MALRVLLYAFKYVFVVTFCFNVTGTEVLFAQSAKTAQELVELGDRLLEDGKSKEAESVFRDAIRKDDSNLEAYTGMAHVALEQEDWKAASEWAERALDRNPDSMEAHYLYAISHRERARYRTISQLIHWTKGVNHFEWVIERDSLYEDVLYQFAVLRRYQEKFDEAIRLAETQIRLKPDLEESHYGLFKIYQHYLHLAKPDRAFEWLSTHPSPYAEYFSGEALRRQERWEAADAVFAELLARTPPIPIQPILLSRARVQYAMGDSLQAQQNVEQAIARISNKLEADFVLDDFKYLMDDRELDTYLQLKTPEDFRAFFRAFWEKRDPLPASLVNVRLQEHYRRLRLAEKDYGFYGFRTWLNSPDRLGELDFTRAYELNREYNDRGFIYIRHGQPSDRVTTVAGAENQNESWRYYGNPQLDFHFERVPDGQATNSWRLAPVPPLAGRDMWGGRYAMRPHSQLEAIERRREIADASRENVLIGLTTERHTWPRNIEPFDIPFLATAFRGVEGLTRFELHFSLPVHQLATGLVDSVNTLEVEVGYAVHDTTWQPIGEEVVTRQFQLQQLQTEGLTGRFQLTARPDTYHVALHSRVVAYPNHLGGHKFDYRFPDFSTSELSMSDVLPARNIEPATTPDPFNRGTLYVVPAPERAYSVNEPVYIYYEVYNLSPGSDGRTRFKLEYTLQPERGRKRLFGLLGRDDRPVLTLSTEQEGQEISPAEHATIDVSKVDPGSYTLTVRVSDHISGTSVERSQKIELRK